MSAEFNAEGREGSVRLLGTRGSAAAYSLRDFLQRSDIAFEWVELATDEQARELAQVDGLRDSRLPVCLFRTALALNARPSGRSRKSSAGSRMFLGEG